MRSAFPRHPAPYALLAGLAIAGCGHHKVQRSDKPASVTVPAAGDTSATTTTPSKHRHGATGTFIGQDIFTKFGEVQVQVTLRNGRIADVQGIKLPYDRPRSSFISRAASPILRSEVLNAQSARINLISGATYTSDAWANSVQSALSQAR